MAKILIVEDDEQLREIFIETLVEAGHSVVSANNGKDAQHLIKQNIYDLIVSDVQMPMMSGIELLQWVRYNSQTPMILMSSFSRLLETVQPSDIGAKGFLTKPFRPEKLVSMVDEILFLENTSDEAKDLRERKI